MRILINGEAPEGAERHEIKMAIIYTLLSSELTGEQVTEIVTTSTHSAFADTLLDFCEELNIACRLSPDSIPENVDMELLVEWED